MDSWRATAASHETGELPVRERRADEEGDELEPIPLPYSMLRHDPVIGIDVLQPIQLNLLQGAVAEDDDNCEDRTLTSYPLGGAVVSDIREGTVETGRVDKRQAMPTDTNPKKLGDLWERISFLGWCRRQVLGLEIPEPPSVIDHAWLERAAAREKLKLRVLTTRCVECGLLAVGAAGAAMLSCWVQHQSMDVGAAAGGASTLDPDNMRMSGEQGNRMIMMDFLHALVPKAVFDSPATLVVSIAVTTLAATGYHYIHRQERYQDPVTVAITGGGALAGRLAGLDGTAVLLQVVPWCVLVSLMLSATWSSRLGRKTHPKAVKAGGPSLNVAQGFAQGPVFASLS